MKVDPKPKTLSEFKEVNGKLMSTIINLRQEVGDLTTENESLLKQKEERNDETVQLTQTVDKQSLLLKKYLAITTSNSHVDSLMSLNRAFGMMILFNTMITMGGKPNAPAPK